MTYVAYGNCRKSDWSSSLRWSRRSEIWKVSFVPNCRPRTARRVTICCVGSGASELYDLPEQMAPLPPAK